MKKGQYSKWIIVIVILLNVAFALGVMWAMKAGAAEPSTLIDRWFDWTTVELLAVTGIKISKLGKELLEISKGRKSE